MRLGYFAMPVHPLHRAPADTLQEDREAIILGQATAMPMRIRIDNVDKGRATRIAMIALSANLRRNCM